MVWGLTLWETFACESVAGGTNRPDGKKRLFPTGQGAFQSIVHLPCVCDAGDSYSEPNGPSHAGQ